MKNIILITLLFGLLFMGKSNAGSGFNSGEDYLSWNANVKAFFISAVLDTVELSLVTPGEPMVFAQKISKCTQSMSLTELTAIVDKYLVENQLEKNEGLAGIVMIALIEVCVE